MFRAQHKSKSPFESWNTLGIYNSESNAISSAMHKKKRGSLMVRVIDKRGAVLFVH
jgi:hypothetical protein